MGKVQVNERLRQRLMDWARVAVPEEGCGLLLGSGRCIADVVQLANNASEPASRYALDPLAYLRAERAAETRGLAVVGIWHSHPHSAAVPSETDRATAWPEWLYLIIGHPADPCREVRAWQLTGPAFTEEELVE